MPEQVVTITERFSRTAVVTVRARDEDAASEEVGDAFGAELKAMIEATGGWRNAEAGYGIEQVVEA